MLFFFFFFFFFVFLLFFFFVLFFFLYPVYSNFPKRQVRANSVDTDPISLLSVTHPRVLGISLGIQTDFLKFKLNLATISGIGKSSVDTVSARMYVFMLRSDGYRDLMREWHRPTCISLLYTT